MSLKWIINLRKYFHVMGFLSKTGDNVREKLPNFIILTIHISLSAWCSLCAFESFIEELNLMEFLDALNFFVYYAFFAVTYWLIIYDSYTKQHDESAFWNMFSQINDGISTNIGKWMYLGPLVLLFGGNIIVMITIAFYEDTSGFFTKAMSFIFLWIYDNRVFYYFLHLKIIAFQLQKIEIELKQLQKKCRRKRLKWICSYHKLAHEMCVKVNSSFGLSNLAMLLLCFHCLVTFLNFIYRQLHQKFYKFNSGAYYSIIHWAYTKQNIGFIHFRYADAFECLNVEPPHMPYNLLQ